MKSSLAVSYAVQKKNKKRGKLESGQTESTHNADNQFAQGGPVRAASYTPTENSGEVHACTHDCQDMTVRDHEMIKAGSQKASANSGNQSNLSLPKSDSSSLIRGGTKGSYDDTDAPKRPKDQGEDNHMGTLAEAIAKRLSKHLMAGGGEVRDDSLDEATEEHGNEADDLNFEALGKEHYDDSQLDESYDDSDETGDKDEKGSENKNDKSFLSKIKARSGKRG